MLLASFSAADGWPCEVGGLCREGIRVDVEDDDDNSDDMSQRMQQALTVFLRFPWSARVSCLSELGSRMSRFPNFESGFRNSTASRNLEGQYDIMYSIQ